MNDNESMFYLLFVFEELPDRRRIGNDNENAIIVPISR